MLLTIEPSEVELGKLITHQVGNKSKEEGYKLSIESSSYGEDTLE